MECGEAQLLEHKFSFCCGLRRPAKVTAQAPAPVQHATPPRASAQAPAPVQHATPARASARRHRCSTQHLRARVRKSRNSEVLRGRNQKPQPRWWCPRPRPGKKCAERLRKNKHCLRTVNLKKSLMRCEEEGSTSSTPDGA